MPEEYYDQTQPHKTQSPARAHFSLENVRRIPVTVSEKASSLMIVSSKEGRKFSQALSEILGSIPELDSVQIDAYPRSTDFEIGPEHIDPVTGEEAHMLYITVLSGSTEVQQWILRASDLTELRGGKPIFNARETALELARLYQESKEV